MSRKRVHEIAKQQGLTSKEVLAALNAAGIEATAAASSVEEEEALEALAARGGDGAKGDAKPAQATASPRDATKKSADGKGAAKGSPEQAQAGKTRDPQPAPKGDPGRQQAGKPPGRSARPVRREAGEGATTARAPG